jgi:hypothetical protein
MTLRYRETDMDDHTSRRDLIAEREAAEAKIRSDAHHRLIRALDACDAPRPETHLCASCDTGETCGQCACHRTDVPAWVQRRDAGTLPAKELAR